MTINLDELRKIAEAATPGPWVLDGFAEGGCSEGCCEEYTRLSVYSVTNRGEVVASEVTAQRNADYFDAFDPPAVLALLSRLEQAEQAVQRVQQGWDEYKSKLGAQIPEYYRRNIDGALTGHWMTAGGTPTGEFADVCSCGKSYWPCTALDGDGRG